MATGIGNVAQLQAMGNSGDYFLTNDIDMTGHTTWTPLHEGAAFTGTFDGMGYTISNFQYIKQSSVKFSYFGLWALIGSGSVSNLTMTDANITLTTVTGSLNLHYIGILAGICNGPLDNCHVSGQINTVLGSGAFSTASEVGGLIGYSNSTSITDCSADVAITIAEGGSAVGGFLGIMQGSGVTLSGCSATGDIIGGKSQSDHGGFGAQILIDGGSTITDCFATGSLTLTGIRQEGFNGGFGGTYIIEGESVMSGCYSTGDVSITSDSIEGSHAAFISLAFGFEINNSYTTGNLTLTSTASIDCTGVGGFVGIYFPDDDEASGNTQEHYNNYAISDITISGLSDGVEAIGGFAGMWGTGTEDQTYHRIYNCYHVGTIDIQCQAIGASGDIRHVGGFIGLLSESDGYAGTDTCILTVNKVFHEGNINIVSNDRGDVDVYEVGGLIGTAHFDLGGLLKDVYAKGDITISADTGGITIYHIGGLLGEYEPKKYTYLANAFSTCDVTITTPSPSQVSKFGGMIGIVTGENSQNKGINLYSCGVILVRDLALNPYLASSSTGGYIGNFSNFAQTNCRAFSGAYHKSIGNPAVSLSSLGYGSDEADANAFKNSNHGVYNLTATTHKSQTGQYDFSIIETDGWDPAPNGMQDIDTYGWWFDHLGIDLYPDFRMHDGEFPGDADLGESYHLFDVDEDCGYAGIAVGTIPNMDHLEGQTVSILANGTVLDQQVVLNGTLNMGSSYSVAHIGLPFYSDIETLAVEVPSDEGTVQSKKVKVGAVTFRIKDSRGGYIGPNEDDLWPAFTNREINLSSGQNIEEWNLFTCDVRQPLGGQYGEGGHVFYRQSDPLPITIGAIIPEVAVGGQAR